jgi:hypothetical protein
VRAPTCRLALAAASALAPPLGAQEATNRDQSGYTELHEKGFPARVSPPAVPAAEARLRDDEIVIGVVANGEARAYPVNLMWKPENEVLNDTLGGQPVAATWCPIAHSAGVYDRTAEGGPLELGAIGLEKGVFILYDRQSGSWWSQVTGRGVRGPRRGGTLAKRHSTLTTWGLWRRLHPGTTVFADPGRPGRRRFTEESLNRITQAGGGPVLNEDLVVAVEGSSSARAYLLRRLAQERVVHDVVDGRPILVLLAEDGVTARVLRRTAGGRTLTFTAAAGDRLRDAETGSSWDALTGRALAGPLAGQRLGEVVFTYALWYAWRSQRPGTTLWGEGASQDGRSERPARVPPQ